MLIYEALLPPAPFLNPPTYPNPTSPWIEDLKMRKALTQVCKRWRQIALQFLYQDVTLNRVGQVFAFAWTVQSSSSIIAPLVRSISFICPHIPNHLRALVSNSATKILKYCHQVTALRFGPEFLNHYLQKATFDLSVDDELFIAALRDVAPKITVLRSEQQPILSPPSTGSFTQPLRFVSTFPSLQSLALPLSGKQWGWKSSALYLDNLEEFTLWLTEKNVESNIAVISGWTMPRLRRVDIRTTFPPLGRQSYSDALDAFFHCFGTNVKELNFGFSFLVPKPPDDVHGDYLQMAAMIEQLVASCPSLEYLSCPPCCQESLLRKLFLRDPPVQLDMWGTPRQIRFIPDSEIIYPNIRIIDNTLLNTPDLPRYLLRPLKIETSNVPPIIHHVYDAHIVQTSFAVFQLGSENWNEAELRKALRDDDRRVKMQRWVSGLPEFDFDERVEYAYQVETDSDSDSDSDAEYVATDLASSRNSGESSDSDVESEAAYYETGEYEIYPFSDGSEEEYSDGDSDGEDEDEDSPDTMTRTLASELTQDSSDEAESMSEQEVLAMFFDNVNRDMGRVVYAKYANAK